MRRYTSLVLVALALASATSVVGKEDEVVVATTSDAAPVAEDPAPTEEPAVQEGEEPNEDEKEEPVEEAQVEEVPKEEDKQEPAAEGETEKEDDKEEPVKEGEAEKVDEKEEEEPVTEGEAEKEDEKEEPEKEGEAEKEDEKGEAAAGDATSATANGGASAHRVILAAAVAVASAGAMGVVMF